MQRWEHYTNSYEKFQDLQTDLEKLEQDGWEAVSLVTAVFPLTIQGTSEPSTAVFFLLMKRRVEEEEDEEDSTDL